MGGETRYLPSMEVTSPEYDAWFQPHWEQQERSKGRFEEGGWALPVDLASKITDPRARNRCRHVVEQKPDGEANRRVGDPTWEGKRVARLQWPKRLFGAKLGTMEVELAGTLAALEKLAADMPLAHSETEVGHCRAKLEERLQALEDGTFPLPRLLG